MNLLLFTHGSPNILYKLWTRKKKLNRAVHIRTLHVVLSQYEHSYFIARQYFCIQGHFYQNRNILTALYEDYIKLRDLYHNLLIRKLHKFNILYLLYIPNCYKKFKISVKILWIYSEMLHCLHCWDVLHETILHWWASKSFFILWCIVTSVASLRI